jgi:hypothetical protein
VAAPGGMQLVAAQWMALASPALLGGVWSYNIRTRSKHVLFLLGYAPGFPPCTSTPVVGHASALTAAYGESLLVESFAQSRRLQGEIIGAETNHG